MTEASSDRRVWPNGGISQFDVATMPNGDAVLLQPGESFAIVGDGFLQQMTAILTHAGFAPIRGEARHPALSELPAERGGYDAFSAAFGEVATARQLRQLFQRANGSFVPGEDRWRDGETVIDPFRPDLVYAARSDQEFDVLRERHFTAVRAMVRRAATLIVSLGAIETVETIADGAVLPIGTDDARFDPAKHVVRSHTLTETIADLEATIADLRKINPAIRIVLTLSPRPIARTEGDDHVAVADTLAKAVLRVAMAQAATIPGVTYFPAREIALVTAPAYKADGRTPSAQAVDAIARAFVGACAGTGTIITPRAPIVPIAPAPAEAEATPAAPRQPRKQRRDPADRKRREERGGNAKTSGGRDASRTKRKELRVAAAAEPRGRRSRTAAAVETPDPAQNRPRREAAGGDSAERTAARETRLAAKAARVPGQRKLERAKEKAAAPDLSHLSPAERRARKEYEKMKAETDTKPKDSA